MRLFSLLASTVLVALAATNAKAQPSQATPVTSPDAIVATAIVDALYRGRAPEQCNSLGESTRSCLIAARYPKPWGQRLAELATKTGSIFAPGKTELFDGGYRGMIKLVAQEPTADTTKLAWVVASLEDFDRFFAKLINRSKIERSALSYRWHNLWVLFVRSEKKKTPAAFALPWTVTINTNGSLHRSAALMRETMFHEIFHMNDFAHDRWSSSALQSIYSSILERCSKESSAKKKDRCYAPFAPGTTRVKGGTYYAFTQNNGDGVNEYAAELALRYYVEHRIVFAGGEVSAPFKCKDSLNRKAWDALAEEFFASIDVVPACAN